MDVAERNSQNARGKRDYAKYIASLLLFGFNGIVAARIMLPSAQIVFWRTLLGSTLLLALLAAARRPLSLGKYPKDLLMVSLSGAAMGLSWIFLYEAYARIGVSLSSLAYYCAPVLVLLLSPLLFREQLTPRAVAGMAAVFAGMALANGAVCGTVDHVGLLCGGMSALSHAGMVIFSKKAVNIGGMENAAVQLVVSFLTVALYVGITHGFPLPVAASDWPWLLALGLLNTGAGCWLYFSALGRLPVASVSVLGYLEPLSAVLLAVLLLHEPMSGPQWLGVAMILGGTLFCEGRRPSAVQGCAAEPPPLQKKKRRP